MDQTDVNALQAEVQQFLEIFEPYVESNSQMTWEPSDGFLSVVFRAILRRQFEALQAISQLVATGNASSAGPLLRPACEELIWVKYLTKISTTDAEQLVYYYVLDEIRSSLRAQDKFAGRLVTEEIGLLPFLEKSNAARKGWRQGIQELGKRLDWQENVIREKRMPSMGWLAKETEELSTYDFIYHAASRPVHFSVHELLRRAWGDPWMKTLPISSIHFRDYWAHFCLYWGLFLLIRTDEALDLGDALTSTEMDESRSSEVLKSLKRIRKFDIPLIITLEELQWPTEKK